MKILITGGRGVIGRNLHEFLQGAHDVSCCGRQELDLLDADAVEAYVRRGRFDVVIHSATYDAAPKHSTKDPARVLESNLRMFFNLARCSDQFGRMIYFGSGAEFSRAHWVPKMREDYFDRHVPADQYGFSKYLMTRYLPGERRNIYNLRLFGVFGKYDDWRTRFISNACCRVVVNMPVVMNQNRAFDHVYMEDLARLVSRFLDATPRHHVYNVCSGTVHDFKSLATTLLKVSGKTLDIVAMKEGQGIEYSGDNSRLVEEFGEVRFSSMEAALAELYEWHAQNPQIIVKEQL